MQLIFDFPVNPRYSFDNFVVCSGNNTAFQFATRMINPDHGDNILYLFGPQGSGKTHLLSALAGSFKENIALTSIPYLSLKDLDKIYGGEYKTEELSRLAEIFRTAPALLVDDLHLLPDNASLRAELWQLFNDFHQAGKPIAMTGLYPPRELPHLDDHLVSRLLWGLVARIDVSDDDSRKMIMKKLAEDRQVILPADVVDYLLLHVHRDVPSLIDALDILRGHALVTKRKLTVKLARDSLSMMGG